MINFPDSDQKALEAQAFHGARAQEIRDGADWKWLLVSIFAAMEDQATHTLMNARTEEERMKAQQMFLASRKPVSILDALISQGDAARASLAELAQELAHQAEIENPTLDKSAEEDHRG